MRHPRVESGIAHRGDRIYVVAGYGRGLDEVLLHVDVFDVAQRRWLAPIPMPEGSASSHLGCTMVEDRYLCLAGGQVGPQCHPATDRVQILDLPRGAWRDLPPLPEVRYAPILLHARGRLHAIGGTGVARDRSRDDHWSLAFENGEALEPTWRREAPIPRAGTHRGGAVLENDLFVAGGQVSDARPIAGDAACTCDLSDLGGPVFGDSFRYRTADRVWTAIAPMSNPVSHADLSTFEHGGRLIVAGGSPMANQCGDLVQAYDPSVDRWSAIGRMPMPMKSAAAVVCRGYIHLLGGQRSISDIDLRYGRVVRDCWRARIPPLVPPT